MTYEMARPCSWKPGCICDRCAPYTRRESSYAKHIREEAAAIGKIGYDPRHIEAWMRIEHGTLDALSKSQFRSEVRIACECIDHAPAIDSEELANSYGL